MKRLRRTVIVIFVPWFLIFATSMISYRLSGTPWLMLELQGGEVTQYIGPGYSIDMFYPLVAAGEEVSYPDEINIRSYLVVNTVAVICLAGSALYGRKRAART